MPISHDYMCIFVHIPKCAGTSIEAALGMHGDLNFIGVQPYLDQIVNKSTLFGKGVQHLTAEELETLLGADVFNKYFKFAVVRNPWDRFISYVSWRGRKMGEKKWFDKFPLSKADVDEAVCELSKCSAEPSVVHLRPQYKFIMNDQYQSKVDFIYKFERISDDWRYICNKLGVICHLPKRMQSCHGHYSKYLSDDQVCIIGDYFQKDIELFGYEFERKP